MCLILFAYKVHPAYPLILAANRDEFYDRPTQPIDFWKDAEGLLAGRDLLGGGTWLGVTRSGRLAAITNFRDPGAVLPDAPSRGVLVQNFLQGNDRPEDYLKRVEKTGRKYNGFNLLVGDTDSLWYYGNRAPGIRPVPPGIHGLSNHLLDTPWPKVRTGTFRFKKILAKSPPEQRELENELFQLLSNTTCPPDADLPDTGVGRAWEKILAPLFIKSDIYGTRNSSILFIARDGRIDFVEKTFRPTQTAHLKSETVRFSFQIERCFSL